MIACSGETMRLTGETMRLTGEELLSPLVGDTVCAGDAATEQSTGVDLCCAAAWLSRATPKRC